MLGVWIGLGAVVALMLAMALVSDVRDRGNGGTRRVLMPRWGARRTTGMMRSTPVDWGPDAETLRPPRAEDEDRDRD